jgi:hypothetical protein
MDVERFIGFKTNVNKIAYVITSPAKTPYESFGISCIIVVNV